MGRCEQQLKTNEAMQCRTSSRNVCGPSSETDASACIGSCAPRVSNFFLLVLNRNTDTTCSTSHDTGTTASPHCILLAPQLTMPACSLSPHKDRTQTCDRNCPTSLRNTHEPCTEPWRNDISNFFPLARSFHRVLASEPQRSVLGCRHVQCNGLDDTMWWHSAPVASTPSATQNSNSPVWF